MTETTKTSYKIEFSGRKNIIPFFRITFITIGILSFLLGIAGLFKQNSSLTSLHVFQIYVGVHFTLLGLIGKEILKSKNYLVIEQDWIKFKNWYKRAQKIHTNDISELKIRSDKVDFIMNNNELKVYDFSVFTEETISDIISRLEKLKL